MSKKFFGAFVPTVVIVFVFVVAAQASAPHGWLLAGSKPADYETGIDPQAAYHDAQSAYLKSKTTAAEGDGFGTLMQTFRAEQYAGKRVRLSAFVKSEEVQAWAGLWMRIDKGSSVVGFDNMQSRPIKGTSDWRRYDVVLDVPRDATGIAFGVLLAGPGTVWLNSSNFEVVDSSVPSTQRESLPSEPVNLDFRN